MTFRFRKLYADVVSDDGTVTIVYLTWLELWGARFASAGVERYGPDGGREVQRARPQAWEFNPDVVGDGWSVRLELPTGDFELRYQSALSQWRPRGEPPDPAMEWRVLIPRATVVGRSSGPGAPEELRGTGYCDWVDLRRPPRLLGMRRLRWGRVHLPSKTVVFTALKFASGRTWGRVARWHGRQLQPHGGAVELGEGQEAGRLGIPEGDTGLLAFAPIHLLHDGPGLDRARFPAAPTRLVARALTGALYERRWLASSAGSGWAVHEAVSFGNGGQA